ncbi:DUF3530 domain-containing protein [Marinobacter fuscus]|uniref:DUF3530 domain-containing protein n=1 Tax=Marinobacter fuscus TaxID=2109942 RepID=A0A2T1K4X8_9GAMM|nr:DUF3530 family protein [Marinobacter fuscus]PSF05234.1 DUF3530 domain-containing protein [Marinobacter fuscus]
MFAYLWLLTGWAGWALAQEPTSEPEPALESEAVPEAAAVARTGAWSGLGQAALAGRYLQHAVWLDLEQDGPALALFQPELSSPGHGALLLLVDEGQTADEGLAGALRQALAERGFAVMTVAAGLPPEAVRRQRLLPRIAEPEPEALASPMQDTAGAAATIDVAASGALDDAVSAYRNRVNALLAAGFAELQRRGYERPGLSGVGWSADYVASWASGNASVSGVVWIAPQFALAREAELPSLLKTENNDGAVPVLDLQPPQARASGKARAGAFARAGIASYQRQSVVMAEPPRAVDAERVASRISAWLQRRLSPASR